MILNMHKTKDLVYIKACPANVFLRSMGVKEGVLALVVSKQPLGGPVIIRINHRDIAIDLSLAKEIVTQMAVHHDLP